MDHWIEKAVGHKGELKPEKKAAGLMDGSANLSFGDLRRLARPNSSLTPDRLGVPQLARKDD
jgi:hypothetical protein